MRVSQAEGTEAFSQFHLYVCSAFLVKWSEKLRNMDFQVRIVIFYQCLSLVFPIDLAVSLGDHHVLAVAANARLD